MIAIGYKGLGVPGVFVREMQIRDDRFAAIDALIARGVTRGETYLEIKPQRPRSYSDRKTVGHTLPEGCDRCGENNWSRHGSTSSGKPRFQCKHCGRMRQI